MEVLFKYATKFGNGWHEIPMIAENYEWRKMGL